MGFYGVEATPLGVYQAEQLCCAKCGGENSVKIKVFAKYFHISQIPSFPMGKIGVAVCQNCQHSVEEHGFDHMQAYKTAYYNIKAKTRTPFWACAGTGVTLLLLSLAGYSIMGV